MRSLDLWCLCAMYSLFAGFFVEGMARRDPKAVVPTIGALGILGGVLLGIVGMVSGIY